MVYGKVINPELGTYNEILPFEIVDGYGIPVYEDQETGEFYYLEDIELIIND